jgi:Glycosyltransferase Family 4
MHELAAALAAAGHDVELVGARWQLPDAPFRLRKIGDRPGRLPATLHSLATGRFDVAQAFTAQDAVAAVWWARVAGRPAVFSVCEPLRRATLADRRLRLAQLRLALERSAAVVTPDEAVAHSIRAWMAVEPRVVSPGSADGHLALYAELGRR